VIRVTLHTRMNDSEQWSPSAMTLAGRRTYTSEIKWRDVSAFMDYYVAAEIEDGGMKKSVTSPPEAPHRHFTVTLL
jgi:hypothetical protein